MVEGDEVTCDREVTGLPGVETIFGVEGEVAKARVSKQSRGSASRIEVSFRPPRRLGIRLSGGDVPSGTSIGSNGLNATQAASERRTDRRGDRPWEMTAEQAPKFRGEAEVVVSRGGPRAGLPRGFPPGLAGPTRQSDRV